LTEAQKQRQEQRRVDRWAALPEENKRAILDERAA